MKAHLKPYKKPYKRVLLKVSGEAFALKSSHLTYEFERVLHIAYIIQNCQKQGLEVVVVLGGGNLIRGADLLPLGLKRPSADTVGMLSTMMNGLVLADFLRNQGVAVQLLSYLAVEGALEAFNATKSQDYLAEGKVLIVVGGSARPYFTTDTASALTALQTDCDALFKLTKVDGLYTQDPQNSNHRKAHFIAKASYKQVIEQKLEVMDLTAFTLCQQNNLPIHIGSLENVNYVVENTQSHTSGSLIGGNDGI